MEHQTISRSEALKELKTFGISGPEAYFIDVIPLIEMIWSDGQAQDSEMAIFNEFLTKHVQRLNKQASYKAFSVEDALRFVSRFFKEKPDSELLRLLRKLAVYGGISKAGHKQGEALKESLLAACLDIAAISTTEYPYGLHDRFDSSEKRCYFEILDTLE